MLRSLNKWSCCPHIKPLLVTCALRLALSGSHAVEPPGREGIGGAQQLEEVVRPKIVAHEAEDGNPDLQMSVEPNDADVLRLGSQVRLQM